MRANVLSGAGTETGLYAAGADVVLNNIVQLRDLRKM